MNQSLRPLENQNCDTWYVLRCVTIRDLHKRCHPLQPRNCIRHLTILKWRSLCFVFRPVAWVFRLGFGVGRGISWTFLFLPTIHLKHSGNSWDATPPPTPPTPPPHTHRLRPWYYRLLITAGSCKIRKKCTGWSFLVWVFSQRSSLEHIAQV